MSIINGTICLQEEIVAWKVQEFPVLCDKRVRVLNVTYGGKLTVYRKEQFH